MKNCLYFFFMYITPSANFAFPPVGLDKTLLQDLQVIFD
jgi:hypothetical protein